MLGFSVLRPEFLAFLLLLPAIWLVWRAWPSSLAVRRSRLALGLRILLVLMLVLAIAGVRLTIQPQQRSVVAVVDLSASTRAGIDAEAQAVRTLSRTKGPDDLFGIVTFGHQAAVELPPARNPFFEVFETQPDGSYTDIGGALRLAAGISPDGYARQLVLISDGRQNLGDAAATIASLRAEGVRVDVSPVGVPAASEVMILSVDAPSELHAGQHASVTVRLRSTGTATASLVLQVDGVEVARAPLDIPAGVSSLPFDLPNLEPGLHRVRAELVDVTNDTSKENNVGEAAIRVLGQPTVLVLEGSAGDGDNVVGALQASGMKTDRKLASQAPVDTSVLGRYQAIVTVNTPADEFPAGALDAIDAVVKNLGLGLVSVGGPNSYGPGGWKDTGLERALPVRMDLPPRKDKPKVAVVLVIESMENPSLDALTISAAENVIDKLTPEDMVAVSDNRQGGGNGSFVVPMQAVTNLKALHSALESMQPNDGPYLSSLQAAGTALAATDAPLKHIVLLGDGDEVSSGGRTAYQTTLEGLKAKGITTSVIGVNTHGSVEFMASMRDLSRWGGGRFYQSDTAADVPQLLLKESLVSLRPWYEQANFFPKVTSAGDLLSGIPLDAFPSLDGYVVTTIKPNAEQYFGSPKDDPVLAAWQYGLGRSVAWTSDAKGQWTTGFLKNSVSGKLFARMVAWTLPSESGQTLQAEGRVTGDSLELTVNGPAGESGSIRVGIVQPDLKSSTGDLPAIAPGRWQGRVPVSAVGTYLVHVVLSRGGGVLARSDLGVVVPYSPEYLATGRDDASLTEFARLGGKLLVQPQEAWRLPALPVPVSSEIFWILLIVVAVLWPIDVAIRRLTLGPREVLAMANSLVRLRSPKGIIEVEPPPELARLRRRVSGYRKRGPRVAPQPVVASAQRTSGAMPDSAPEDSEAEALSAKLLEARRRRRGSSE